MEQRTPTVSSHYLKQSYGKRYMKLRLLVLGLWRMPPSGHSFYAEHVVRLYVRGKRKYKQNTILFVSILEIPALEGNLTMKVEGAFMEFVFRELRAVAGAITITCLMVLHIEKPELNCTNQSEPCPWSTYTWWLVSFIFMLGPSLCFTSLRLSKGRKGLDDMKDEDENGSFTKVDVLKVEFLKTQGTAVEKFHKQPNPLGNFHGSNADPFEPTIKSSIYSSLHPSFGTSNPFGSRLGPPLFAEKISSPSGSTSSCFGGIQSTTKFGGIASTYGIDNQCRGSALASYRTTPEVDGINSSYPIGKINSISAMPIYKDKSHEELRSEDYKLHKGSIFSIQNQGNAFRQSNTHFGPTVSVPSVKPPFGSTGTEFGVSPSFKPVNSIGVGNVYRAPRNSASEASSTTIFGSPKNSGIGFNSTPPNFHSNSASGSTSSIFGVKVPTFAPAGSSSISGIQGFSGSQGPITPERTIGNYHQGSRVVTYSATPEIIGANNRYSVEKIQSISAMPTYKDKSQEELRSEDYNLRNNGGNEAWCGQSLASASFKTFDSPANIFRNPPLSNQSSFSSPFHPFKSNLSDPKSQDLVTPNSTTSPSPNPFSLAKSNPFPSQAFIPQPTVVSSMPTFNANLHPSFVTPFSESGQTNSCQCPAISTTSTGPSLSAFSLSKLSSTVSPSTQSTSLAALSPWPSEHPSIPNASQPGQTAEKSDCHITNNLSQPSLASSGLTMATEVGYQNINGQQYVRASTVGMQSSFAAPFPTLSAIDRPNTVTSIQHGISSLPVSNSLSSSRRTSLLRIRHVSFRHNWLPAQRHSPGNSVPKVPFFSDQEDGPFPVVPILPRENPRAWVLNPSSLRLYSDGKGCEEKELPSSSFQHNVNPTGVTGGDTSIQEEDSPAILNRHQDNKSTVIQKTEADVLALMPKLPDGEYYTEPSLKELAAKEMAEPGSCTRVNNFVVGRLGYGNIKFLGETDVRYLDLESVVQFNDREVIVYADDREKPPVGQSLNKPAEVTLLNVKCISKKTGKQYVDSRQIRSFKEMLMKKASEQGAEFVSYDPVQGEWKCRVEHF
ncbi:hypothetical protein DH2020_026751 [Rehmannia glutinosa]|uniref:Peptidase S59 domain-containing protein n=1 Tax=Rehmannia glutinosa TaxID=99300 RepID=A0ABR0VW61_REHGL